MLRRPMTGHGGDGQEVGDGRAFADRHAGEAGAATDLHADEQRVALVDAVADEHAAAAARAVSEHAVFVAGDEAAARLGAEQPAPRERLGAVEVRHLLDPERALAGAHAFVGAREHQPRARVEQQLVDLVEVLAGGAPRVHRRSASPGDLGVQPRQAGGAIGLADAARARQHVGQRRLDLGVVDQPADLLAHVDDARGVPHQRALHGRLGQRGRARADHGQRDDERDTHAVVLQPSAGKSPACRRTCLPRRACVCAPGAGHRFSRRLSRRLRLFGGARGGPCLCGLLLGDLRGDVPAVWTRAVGTRRLHAERVPAFGGCIEPIDCRAQCDRGQQESGRDGGRAGKPRATVIFI